MKKFLTLAVFLLLFNFVSFIPKVAGVGEILLGQVGRPLYTLTVTKSGAGSGTVTSDVYNINCGSICSQPIPMGTTVILTAVGDSGSMFNTWSGSGCSGSGTCSILMDGNKTVDANFIIMPQGANLIAWYKFDEGSGLIVNNYATDGSLGGGLFPDLTVDLDTGTFWTALNGFGSTTGQTTRDFAWNKPSRTISGASGACYGRFLRIVGNTTVLNRCGQLITSEIQAGIQISHDLNFPNIWGANWDNGGASIQINQNLQSQWAFHFIANDGKYRIVKPDGTLLTSAGALTLTDSVTVNYLLCSFQYADADPPTTVVNPGTAAMGDWILYNNTTLTLAEWAIWYDQLRTRYGMAARSGW